MAFGWLHSSTMGLICNKMMLWPSAKEGHFPPIRARMIIPGSKSSDSGKKKANRTGTINRAALAQSCQAPSTCLFNAAWESGRWWTGWIPVLPWLRHLSEAIPSMGSAGKSQHSALESWRLFLRTAPPPRHYWRQVSQRGRAVKSAGLGQANSGSENVCLIPDYREQRPGRTASRRAQDRVSLLKLLL